MVYEIVAETIGKYPTAPIAQEIIKHSLPINKDNIVGKIATALNQDNVVATILDHAYKPQERDDWNWEYVKAAKQLETVVARNFYRVARWTEGPHERSETTSRVANAIQQYHREVLGKLLEDSLGSSKFQYLMDQTRDQRDEGLTAAERKRSKAIGQKVEYDPADAERLWNDHIDSEEAKGWKRAGEQHTLQTYSKIMQPIMESIGRTAYKTRDSSKVLQTVDALTIPEVISFLQKCRFSGMAETWPNLIGTLARKEKGAKTLTEKVPQWWEQIVTATEKAEKEFYGD